MHVVLAGGGTAGHIEPALALADALRRRDPAIGITALGTARGMETTLVPGRGFPLELIPAVPLPRRPGRDLLRLPGNLSAAVRRTAEILDRVGADVVVGFGGYVAMPAYVAARRRQVPIVVHEANARPGIANRFGARLTPYVAVGMPGTRLPHSRFLGIPLRRTIATLDRDAERPAGRAYFGLQPDLPTLLVVGGSLGARRLNQVMSVAGPDVARAGVQVLHAVGRGNPLTIEAPPGSAPYVTVPYVDRMDLGYAAADLAMCRGGAMTCAELAAVGLPAAYVPLPIGNGEQRLNATPVVAAGGGVMVDDADLSPAWVREVLLPLALDSERLARMGQAAAAFGRRDADEALAALVFEAARRLEQAAGGEGPRR
jgi:UDP-N-acetylglucosamine--N-acetylmuramyl-(pentapeptide) pyrophosphoryl-undecaprenol N-acetylglucosamine transferase